MANVVRVTGYRDAWYGLFDLNIYGEAICSGLMEPDFFMRDNIVNYRGVNNDPKTQFQAVPKGI
jgi:hypothetical protein